MNTFRKTAAILLGTALSLASASAVVLVTTAEPAFAGNGNGNGNGNGHGNRDRERSNNGRGSEMRAQHAGNNGRGAIARELRNLNAMCANANAMANADPDSNVGRIASFYVAKADADTAAAGLPQEWQNLTAAEVDGTISAIDQLIADNEIEIGGLQETLATLTPGIDDTQISEISGQIAALTQQNTVAAQQKEALASYGEALDAQNEALTYATRGRELSEEALAAFEAGCQR